MPLETRLPHSFVLRFDDTDGVTTGVALANVANVAADITVNVSDDTGSPFQTTTIHLAGRGHTSFLLPDQFPGTGNLRGMVELVTPAGGKISVIGLRAGPGGTLTTIPAPTK
ncbi:MAG: hypothetical protein LAP40_12190 [Acidobacteriia bacterium]|nr:hypothetical protein [Terriglobia bacterium]